MILLTLFGKVQKFNPWSYNSFQNKAGEPHEVSSQVHGKKRIFENELN